MAETLIVRTAKAMYREDASIRNKVDWGSLSPVDHTRYERMARAALKVALAEPVTEVEALASV